jgi:hypothetical protein
MRALVARLRPSRAPHLMIAMGAFVLALLLLVALVATTATPV